MLQEEDNLTPKNSFAKTERICSNKIIKNLIVQNKTIFVYPFKCYYNIEEADIQNNTNQIAISISKRLFKRAVDRNLLKRRTKEAYRIHKNSLDCTEEETNHTHFKILLVYIAREILPYQQIEKSLVQVLKLLSKRDPSTQN